MLPSLAVARERYRRWSDNCLLTVSVYMRALTGDAEENVALAVVAKLKRALKQKVWHDLWCVELLTIESESSPSICSLNSSLLSVTASQSVHTNTACSCDMFNFSLKYAKGDKRAREALRQHTGQSDQRQCDCGWRTRAKRTPNCRCCNVIMSGVAC